MDVKEIRVCVYPEQHMSNNAQHIKVALMFTWVKFLMFRVWLVLNHSTIPLCLSYPVSLANIQLLFSLYYFFLLTDIPFYPLLLFYIPLSVIPFSDSQQSSFNYDQSSQHSSFSYFKSSQHLSFNHPYSSQHTTFQLSSTLSTALSQLSPIFTTQPHFFFPNPAFSYYQSSQSSFFSYL